MVTGNLYMFGVSLYCKSWEESSVSGRNISNTIDISLVENHKIYKQSFLRRLSVLCLSLYHITTSQVFPDHQHIQHGGNFTWSLVSQRQRQRWSAPLRSATPTASLLSYINTPARKAAPATHKLSRVVPATHLNLAVPATRAQYFSSALATQT